MQRRSLLKTLLLAPFAALLPRCKAGTKYKCFVGGKPRAMILNDEFVHTLKIVPPDDVMNDYYARCYQTEPLTEGEPPPKAPRFHGNPPKWRDWSMK